MNDEKLTLLFNGQKLILKTGFVGGVMADATNAPMGMYIGELDFMNANISLVHLLRAVLKLTTEELNMPMDQARSFIEFSLDEAIKRELENKNIDNITVEEHETVLKFKQIKKNS